MLKVGFAPPLLTLVALAACTGIGSPTGIGTSTVAVAPAAATSPGAGPSGASPCPSDAPLEPGADARAMATAAAVAAVPVRYKSPIDTSGFQVAGAYAADPSAGYGAIAYGLCGAAVGQRTWVVELSFPKMLPSADLSAGQLFLSRFAGGWRVWFQYH